MAEDEFFTVSEIASLLKLNQQTVRNWIDQDKLKSVRVGRRVRVRQRDLEQFIEAGASAPAEPELEHEFSAEEAEAWEAFGRAMARTRRKLRHKRSFEGLEDVLQSLVDATSALVETLRAGEPRGFRSSSD